MIIDQENIDLFFIDYDWCTVFRIGVSGDNIKKGLNDINEPTHVNLKTTEDIEAILAFSEPSEPDAPFLLLLKTMDGHYTFFSVAMIEQFEDWGTTIKSTMTYPFISLVGKNLNELLSHLTEKDKDVLDNEYIQVILEKEKFEQQTDINNSYKQKIKI